MSQCSRSQPFPTKIFLMLPIFSHTTIAAAHLSQPSTTINSSNDFSLVISLKFWGENFLSCKFFPSSYSKVPPVIDKTLRVEPLADSLISFPAFPTFMMTFLRFLPTPAGSFLRTCELALLCLGQCFPWQSHSSLPHLIPIAAQISSSARGLLWSASSSFYCSLPLYPALFSQHLLTPAIHI